MPQDSVAVLAAYMAETNRKALPRSWADHACRLSEFVYDHDGHVINVVGEGWFVATFSDALKGTRCAVDMQRGMNEKAEEFTAGRARLHIGVNYEPSPSPGQVWPQTRDDSVDRLVALAEPGGICLSRTVYDEVRFQIDLRFDTTRDPKHTAYVCQEIRRKLGSLNLLESGAVRLGAAALASRNVITNTEDVTTDTGMRTFRKIWAYCVRNLWSYR